MERNQTTLELKRRVLICSSKLIEMGVIYYKYYFSIKYREYIGMNFVDLDKLFRGDIADEKFTEKLEAFVEYKKTEFI